jgi:hypothetical protein
MIASTASREGPYRSANPPRKMPASRNREPTRRLSRRCGKVAIAKIAARPQGMATAAGARAIPRPAMRWTDEEILTLVTLWSIRSATQIAKELHRSRSAVCSMAERLRIHGALPRDVPKRFEVDPRKRKRRGCGPLIMRSKPPPPLDDSEVRPCSLLELDDCRCHRD